MLLVSSSNWLFILFLSFWFVLLVSQFGSRKSPRPRGCSLPHPAEEDAGEVVLVHLGEGGNEIASGGSQAVIFSRAKRAEKHTASLHVERSVGQPHFVVPIGG